MMASANSNFVQCNIRPFNPVGWWSEEPERDCSFDQDQGRSFETNRPKPQRGSSGGFAARPEWPGGRVSGSPGDERPRSGSSHPVHFRRLLSP